MTDQEITKVAEKVKNAIGSEMHKMIEPFYIDRETHYQHHQFMKSFMGWMDKTQSIVLKTVVTVFVLGVIGLVILGFIFWGKEKF